MSLCLQLEGETRNQLCTAAFGGISKKEDMKLGEVLLKKLE